MLWRLLLLTLLLPGCVLLTKDDEYIDDDGDGWLLDEDCNDHDASVHPEADELCGDEVDNDCDGVTDDGTSVDAELYYADTDGDGYGDAQAQVSACTQPEGHVSDDTDCDDTHDTVHPGADEICDELDNDCSGETDDEDEGVQADTWYLDYDSDGFGNAGFSQVACDQPEGYVADATDCDDAVATTHPGADEYCNGVDDDCMGDVDEDDAVDVATWYDDTDADGYGDPDSSDVDCEQPSGYVADGSDCDDTNDRVHPARDETCNGIDDDCDTEVDEDDAIDVATWYADTDGDGFGDADSSDIDCDQPTGFVTDDTDCDDTDADVNPDATEVCDEHATDEDCSGQADDNDPGVTDTSTWYYDRDGDGYGDTDVSYESCLAPSTSWVDNDDDCDDDDATISPSGTERCDGADNDCDGTVDEDDATDVLTWYEDADGDGYGDLTSTDIDCDQPSGYVDDHTDCDDDDASVNPGAREICDADDTDEDCSGDAEDADSSATGKSDYYADSDGDGYGDEDATAVAYCDPPSGYVTDHSDCDDGDSAINPGEDEACDADDTDENCDGLVDDEDSTAIGMSAWYADDDGDGYGDVSVTTDACDQPAGYVSDDDDCDDTDRDVNPGATEVCNTVDDDCNTLVDDDDSGVTDQTTWYPDVDGDGYGDDSATGTDACFQPSGFVDIQGDCDDSDTAYNPAATEDDCGDPEDYNCDGIAGSVDSDGDGYYACEECDDTDSSIHPAATEICDDIDNDCDGLIDDDDSSLDTSTGSTFYADADSDGYGNASVDTASCEAPSGYVSDATDCDDTDADANPGVTEVCNAVDDDCDGATDDDDSSIDTTTQTRYWPDSDGDGYGDDDASATRYCEAPSGWVTDYTDCDDTDGTENPGALEYCDGDDDDCDGDVDEDDAEDATDWYLDADNDGYGDASTSTQACSAPTAYVADDTDCDDSDRDIHPGAAEICDTSDAVDEDCDGLIDDDDSSVTGTDTWYTDADSDGYGDATDAGTEYCHPASGLVDNADDCDDADSAINPDAVEVCDADDVDEDCSGAADDDDSGVSPSTLTWWYPDSDGDGYGSDTASPTKLCEAPSGYVDDDTDCDDTVSTTYLGADEYCDSVDNDCDGTVDEDEAVDVLTWYADTDGDGFGDAAVTDIDCYEPSGYVSDDTDCDDTDSGVNPDADEYCDTVDNDCNGVVDDAAVDATTWYEDADGDGFGLSTSSTEACSQPSGYVSDATDCDDGDSGINPGATEICDALDADEDCDTLSDDDDPSVSSAGFTDFYPDSDSDGYGDGSVTATSQCDAPTGYVADRDDCDDADGSINPSATEICDAADTDEDCDGLADDADSSVDPTLFVDYYPDADSDGFGDDSASATSQCDAPSGYVTDHTDCDDTDGGINTSATEICDAADTDEDCDGLADDADSSVDPALFVDYYPDVDADGYGDDSVSATSQCDAPSGYVTDHTDCDDGETSVNPGATEICDEDDVDEDCDTLADDDDTSVDSSTWLDWYPDSDGDGYGDLYTAATSQCDAPTGYVSDGSDCDDTDYDISPAAAEVCDSGDIDEDCDGVADDDDSSVDTDTYTDWYPDDDSDGYGNQTATPVSLCDAPAGYVADSTDCDDGFSSINPAATEVCDEDDADEDCDGLSDDDDTSVDTSTYVSYYPDSDSDGYGDLNSRATNQCNAPSGYVADVTDCDDSDYDINPAATEVCDVDDIDEDCDGYADDDDSSVDTSTYTEWYPDADSDGYGDQDATATSQCGAPSGYVSDNTDCDDTLGTSYPGATDAWYDGVDSDCAGNSDYDADEDGYDSDDYSGTDCDDGDAGVNPGETEVCEDGVDNDCDGTTNSCEIEGSLDVSDADGILYGVADGDWLGLEVAPAQDLTGDGVADVLLSAPGMDSLAPDSGEAYLISGSSFYGASDYAASKAAAVFQGSHDKDYLGWAVDGRLDVTKDGFPDILLGAPGYDSGAGVAFLMLDSSAYSGTYAPEGDGVQIKSVSTEALGEAVSYVGDYDSDGTADMLLGAPDNKNITTDGGVAYLVLGDSSLKVGDTLSVPSDSEATFYGDDSYTAMGTSVSGSDIDSDGVADLLVGGPGAVDSSSNITGGVFLYLGSSTHSGNLQGSDADVIWYGAAKGDEAGTRVVAADDLDGDGYEDILVGAPGESTVASEAGMVYVLLWAKGSSGAYDLSAAATASISGVAADERVGDTHSISVTGDLDSDSSLDLAVGAPYHDGLDTDSGGTFVFYGTISGSSLTTDGDALFDGTKVGDCTGCALAIPGDLDDDGYDDLVIGAAYGETSGVDAGEVYLLLGGAL